MSEWMLWSRFGDSVQLGSAPPPRLYLVPCLTSIDVEGPLAACLGHRNRDDRTLEGFTRAFERAVSSESDGVIFPGTFLMLPFRNEVLARCQNRKLRVVHQLTAHFLSHRSTVMPALLDELDERLDAGNAVNIVFGADSLPDAEVLARVAKRKDSVYFTYSVRSRDSVFDVLARLSPFVQERLFFHFPFHVAMGDGHLSCRRVYDLIEKIPRRFPKVRVRPMPGTELFDPRVDADLELEPLYAPLLEYRSNDGQDHAARVPIEVSVIIPSYNNRDYLVNTLKHLMRQDFSRRHFEIIIVDDGSNDGTEEAIRNLVSPYEKQLNFKYIYSPRAKPRKMGDANYRAGISRNLGVKSAAGRLLCFLDSDILTPPDFLSDLVEQHKKYDVVQCTRLNLNKEKSNATIRYEEIDVAKDTFLTEDGYWEKFYALKNWSEAPFFWKYTCTYGLSISSQLYKRVGWIRRGFVFYGFEDVEFGYRLARVGARFHLNNLKTYHLFHRDERSEFRNSDTLRQNLLAKTAQIFFLNTLDPEIFRHFRGSMKEQLSFVTIPENLWRLKIPFLAMSNWRIVLWHRKNNLLALRSKLPLQFAERAAKALLLGRVLAWGRNIWSLRWKVEVAATRVWGFAAPWLFKASYPVRKVYYFAAYQLEKSDDEKIDGEKPV